MTIIFDTCIILDYLLNRKEFVKDSETIIFKAVNKEINGILTVKSVMDIHYFLRKTLHNEKKTREIITILLDSFTLYDSRAEETIYALNSKIYNFEDALNVETAIFNKVDGIVTRNLLDYNKAKIPVYSPLSLIEKIN